MLNTKEIVRKISPARLWQIAGFIKRLPMHWRLERSTNLHLQKRLTGFSLHLTDEVFVQIPENVTSYVNWRSHGLEDPGCSAEAAEFLELASGKSGFVDVGAQTGFMSALFARSRLGPAHILSLEPDPQVLALLQRARLLNSNETIDWQVLPEAVSNSTGILSMPISNTLYEMEQNDVRLGTMIEVPAKTLADVLKQISWTPDIIKIDVESFEYEILTSSMELLASLKPALQLEIHWDFLHARGLAAADFLGPLADIGYKGIRKRYADLAAWKKAGNYESLSRYSLHAT